jgi:hypothetical protein
MGYHSREFYYFLLDDEVSQSSSRDRVGRTITFGTATLIHSFCPPTTRLGRTDLGSIFVPFGISRRDLTIYGPLELFEGGHAAVDFISILCGYSFWQMSCRVSSAM